MKSLIIVVFIFFLVKFGTSGNPFCDSERLIYEELGCEPVYKEHKCCPVYYSCPSFEPISGYCRYRGKQYSVEEGIPLVQADDSCLFGCTCGENGNNTRIYCAMPSCFIEPQPNEKCYSIRKDLDGCCNYGWKCPPFDGDATCKVDNKVYKEGDSFAPQNVCSHCLCQKGFKGDFIKPYCKKTFCGLDIWYTDAINNYCAPIYGVESLKCCPSEYLCLSDIKHKIEIDICKKDVDYPSCKFGDLEIPYKAKFNATIDITNIRHLSCSCSIPPLLSCKYI